MTRRWRDEALTHEIEHYDVRVRWRIPRALARAPIPLFRRGFGWLAGPRLLMLEHVGRSSRLPRYVVLEVIDRRPGEWLVLSAYGASAQWLRNVTAEPRVRVWWMRQRGVACRAVVLDRTAAYEALEPYVRDNPRLARVLSTLTTGAPRSLDLEGLLRHLTREARVVSLSREELVA